MAECTIQLSSQPGVKFLGFKFLHFTFAFAEEVGLFFVDQVYQREMNKPSNSQFAFQLDQQKVFHLHNDTLDFCVRVISYSAPPRFGQILL